MLEQIKKYQPEAVKFLGRALKRKRLPHALVISSPGDVGENELVIELAKYMLCQQPGQLFVACQKCFSCQACDNLKHPDLHIVKPKGLMRAIKTADILALISKIQTTSHAGGAKIGIVFQAETLNVEGANRFLKTLEEPPPNTYFVLVTTRPERLLQTIKSRCQIIRLLPLKSSIIKERLSEEFELSSQDLDFITAMARGRWGRAKQVALNIASYRSDIYDIVEILANRKDSSLRAVRFAQLKASAQKKLREGYEQRVKQEIKDKRLQLKDLETVTRRTIIAAMEEQLKSEQATIERGSKASLFEMIIELWRDVMLCQSLGSTATFLHSFLKAEIIELASLYSQVEIIRNLKEIELVRGPAVFLNAKFDVVLQGLLANMTSKINTFEPLQRAIRATGL